MASTSSSADQDGAEQLRFRRAPVDRLFLGCVLAACVGYAVFLIIVRLMPHRAEAPAKQSYMGVVEGQSQPAGGGPGEDDPAEGVAVRGGAGSAYYAGGGRPRPVVLIDGGPGGGPGGTPSTVVSGEVPMGLATGPVQIDRVVTEPIGVFGHLSALAKDKLGAMVQAGVKARGELDTSEAPGPAVPLVSGLRGQGCSSP